MSDRTFVGLLLAGCGIVLIGLVWFVGAFTTPPRSAHHAEVAPASNEFELLSQKIDDLSNRLSGQPMGVGGASSRAPVTPTPGEILVAWTDDLMPFTDPAASAWTGAPMTTVALQVQDQTMPVLDELTVPQVEVRALTNGRQIGWHLSWDDATSDFHLDTDLFCDAVAVQFPLITNAAYTMGAMDFPVQIIQWKAIWQKDIDEHFQDVQDLHPNYWTDLYWFAEGEFPYPVPESFQRTEALDWFVAYRAGNPMAELYRVHPVQELIAEGFGTLTNQPGSVSVGGGVWANDRWSVVISRPMETNDPADYQFTPGVRDVVAFAVWEGSVANVSGRKHHSQWIVFEVQE